MTMNKTKKRVEQVQEMIKRSFGVSTLCSSRLTRFLPAGRAAPTINPHHLPKQGPLDESGKPSHLRMRLRSRRRGLGRRLSKSLYAHRATCWLPTCYQRSTIGRPHCRAPGFPVCVADECTIVDAIWRVTSRLSICCIDHPIPCVSMAMCTNALPLSWESPWPFARPLFGGIDNGTVQFSSVVGAWKNDNNGLQFSVG